MGNIWLRWYRSIRDKRKNGVIRVAILLQPMKQKMALKKNGVILNGKKRKGIPDGDTLCCYRCGANGVAAIWSRRRPAW